MATGNAPVIDGLYCVVERGDRIPTRGTTLGGPQPAPQYQIKYFHAVKVTSGQPAPSEERPTAVEAVCGKTLWLKEGCYDRPWQQYLASGEDHGYLAGKPACPKCKELLAPNASVTG